MSTGELEGWKAIADHLGVGTRTAQNWEKQRGLPVKRLGDGPRARVFASIGEIEQWREAAFRQAHASQERGTSWRRIAWTALAASALAAVVWSWWPPGNPASTEIRNARLRVLDDENKVLWSRDFPGMQEHAYAPIERLVTLADIDEDGLNEVLFALARGTGETDTLYCLGPTGATRWTYAVDDWMNGAPALPGAYKANGGVGAVSDGERVFVLLLTIHSTEGQGRVALLDPGNGQLLDEYWHPGRLDAFLTTNLDSDPGDEVILRGYNNPQGLGHAAVASLNVPFDRPEENRHAEENYYGPWNAKERDYLLFPRIPAHTALRKRTGAHGAYFEEDMLVFVTSTTAEGMHSLYYFDGTLQTLLRFRPSDPLLSNHRALYRQGILARDATPEEITRWARVKRFPTAPDGDDPMVAATVASSEEIAASIHTGETPPSRLNEH